MLCLKHSVDLPATLAGWVGIRKTRKPKSTADHMTSRNQVLTSIVADDEIHIGPKLERAEQVVAHEIL